MVEFVEVFLGQIAQSVEADVPVLDRPLYGRDGVEPVLHPLQLLLNPRQVFNEGPLLFLEPPHLNRIIHRSREIS